MAPTAVDEPATTASDASLVGNEPQTSAEINVSWVVLYEGVTTTFYQSSFGQAHSALSDLYNSHRTLKNIMGYTQNLNSGAESEEFNGENSISPLIPVHPLLMSCVYVTALLQATADPGKDDEDLLETLPSRYLEQIPQIVNWISSGELEWIAHEPASVSNIQVWARGLKAGLTRFDENARRTAAHHQIDVQLTRQALARDISYRYGEGYKRLKWQIGVGSTAQLEPDPGLYGETPSSSHYPPW